MEAVFHITTSRVCRRQRGTVCSVWPACPDSSRSVQTTSFTTQQHYTIVYKCIHGAAPSYLTNICVPVATNTSRCYLRSATHGDLLVPRTRTVTYGPRSFAVSGPTVWNTLPSTLRVSTTMLGQFQSGLTTILFRLVIRDMIRRFRDCLGR